MMRRNLEGHEENTLMYETMIEVAGEIFVMQRRMSLINNNQLSISYKNQAES